MSFDVKKSAVLITACSLCLGLSSAPIHALSGPPRGANARDTAALRLLLKPLAGESDLPTG